jgi:hypothetical protein
LETAQRCGSELVEIGGIVVADEVANLNWSKPNIEVGSSSKILSSLISNEGSAESVGRAVSGAGWDNRNVICPCLRNIYQDLFIATGCGTTLKR